MSLATLTVLTLFNIGLHNPVLFFHLVLHHTLTHSQLLADLSITGLGVPSAAGTVLESCILDVILNFVLNIVLKQAIALAHVLADTVVLAVIRVPVATGTVLAVRYKGILLLVSLHLAHRKGHLHHQHRVHFVILLHSHAHVWVIAGIIVAVLVHLHVVLLLLLHQVVLLLLLELLLLVVHLLLLLLVHLLLLLLLLFVGGARTKLPH